MASRAEHRSAITDGSSDGVRRGGSGARTPKIEDELEQSRGTGPQVDALTIFDNIFSLLNSNDTLLWSVHTGTRQRHYNGRRMHALLRAATCGLSVYSASTRTTRRIRRTAHGEKISSKSRFGVCLFIVCDLFVSI